MARKPHLLRLHPVLPPRCAQQTSGHPFASPEHHRPHQQHLYASPDPRPTRRPPNPPPPANNDARPFPHSTPGHPALRPPPLHAGRPAGHPTESSRDRVLLGPHAAQNHLRHYGTRQLPQPPRGMRRLRSSLPDLRTREPRADLLRAFDPIRRRPRHGMGLRRLLRHAPLHHGLHQRDPFHRLLLKICVAVPDKRGRRHVDVPERAPRPRRQLRHPREPDNGQRESLRRWAGQKIPHS